MASGLWRRRLLAVALGLFLLPLVILGAAEGLLAAIGYADDIVVRDPTSGFSGRVPPYERRGDAYVVAPAFEWTDLVHDSFPVVKPPRSIRVFFLGGSATRGHISNKMETQVFVPFAARIEGLLPALLPDSPAVQCVNLGMAGYGSTREAILARWIAERGSADAVVVYVGHNEVPEIRFRLGYFRDDWRFQLRVAAWRWRLYHLLANLRRRLFAVSYSEGLERIRPETTRDDRAVLGVAPSSPRAGRGGGSDADLAAEVVRKNVIEMARTLGTEGIPLLVIPEVPDLAHTVPQVSAHGPALPDSAAARVEALCAEAAAVLSDDPRRAEALAREATEIDPVYAEGWWLLGRSLRALGRRSEAREAFWEACDLDRFAFRATRPILEGVREAARGAPNAFLVEVEPLFYTDDPADDAGFFAEGLLSDHCHPTQEGHDRIAGAVAVALAEILRSKATWTSGGGS